MTQNYMGKYFWEQFREELNRIIESKEKTLDFSKCYDLLEKNIVADIAYYQGDWKSQSANKWKVLLQKAEKEKMTQKELKIVKETFNLAVAIIEV